MGRNKITEYTEKKGIATTYYETKLYDQAHRLVAKGIGKTKQESIEKAYKNLREKRLG